MVDAVLSVHSPQGVAADWLTAGVAGLAVIDRQLMSLRAAGARRVRVACGAEELVRLRSYLESRGADRRYPAFDLVEDAGGHPPGVPVFDACRVRHPDWLRHALAGGTNGPRAAAMYDEDVTTRAGRARARRAILQSLRKPTDGWFARTIDRSVSLAISRTIAPLPIHPNAVTIVTLGVGILSGVCAAKGSYAWFVAAGALFLLASILDGVDGELARMKFQGSELGQWLDTVGDDLTNAVYLAGVTVGAYRTLASPFLLWSGVAAVALDVITVALLYWQLVTRVNARTMLAFEETILAPALKQRGLAGLVARLQPFIKRDIYAPLFLVFALAGVAWVSLPATAVALAVTLVFVFRDLASQKAGSPDPA